MRVEYFWYFEIYLNICYIYIFRIFFNNTIRKLEFTSMCYTLCIRIDSIHQNWLCIRINSNHPNWLYCSQIFILKGTSLFCITSSKCQQPLTTGKSNNKSETFGSHMFFQVWFTDASRQQDTTCPSVAHAW